ncbi:amidohydrolase [Kineosporia sp. J2-2]|uniref:Amidohydrolase n=1 Tax=Kineosporia corallincola TaxID=2835133 RepID=A0ABS5THZ9_9ACTN|nr:M20 family metallopeptidase [Kineosporia corallincola]MBT0770722.1 amidohydrolase [Kineosporia corallincola]
MTFLTEAARITPELVDLRRRLHAEPELRLDLPKTQAKVLEALSGLDLEITTGQALTSVVGVLRGGRPGPVVLLRGDMDGLPIEEATGLDYASHNGAMHACGHDLHTAGLVGAAQLLHERREELPGTVIFAFQPGEEGAGGARIMLEEGLLDVAGERPVAAYAVHVDCGDPFGVLSTRPGPIMSSSGGMYFRVKAAGGHAAIPHHGVDPVPVAAEIILAVQSFVTRRIPVTDPAVISVTRLASDSVAKNVIPSWVDIDLNVRTLSRRTLDLVRTELPRMVRGLAAVHRCEVDVEVHDSYPVTHNDPAETARVLALLEELYGPARVETLPTPGMASEDFSYVLEQVPGNMYFLGVAHDQFPGRSLHSATAVFDDSLLGEQAATLAELAWRRLTAG